MLRGSVCGYKEKEKQQLQKWLKKQQQPETRQVVQGVRSSLVSTTGFQSGTASHCFCVWVGVYVWEWGEGVWMSEIEVELIHVN